MRVRVWGPLPGRCQGEQRGKRDLDGFWANKTGISAGCSAAQMICSVLVAMAALTPRCASLCQGTGGTWIQPLPGSRSSISASSALEKIYSSCAKVLCCHRHSAPRDSGGIYGLINEEQRLTGRNDDLKAIPELWTGQKAAAHEGWLHTAFLGCSFPQARPE